MRTKVREHCEALVSSIHNGATIAVGGFGACGTPIELIDALIEAGPQELWIVSNNCGTDDYGLGRLLANGQIRRITASYVGDNSVLARMYGAGEVELELCPQGTLAEKMRAGGAGIAAFFTPTGLGTAVALGGMPIRYAPDGSVALYSMPKRVERFDHEDYVLEHAIIADFALVHASVADTAGNLVYRRAARNFNPLAAMCARTTLVEAERIVPAGSLDPETIHTPGIFVQHMTQARHTHKRVDRLTLNNAPEDYGVML